MKLWAYAPEDFPILHSAALEMDAESLTFQAFVDWYYTRSDTCRLWLLKDDDGDVLGTVGVDVTPFLLDGEPLSIGFASNFYARRSGAGGLLFLKWLKSAPLGAVFGGSEQTHHILRHQKWTYYDGIRIYTLNRDWIVDATEPLPRRLAKGLLRLTDRPVALERRAERLPKGLAQRLSIEELQLFTDDLRPQTSTFRLRCAPDAAYMRWRYDTTLPFIRYRLFRLASRGRSIGYVVIHETERRITVAQSDGEDAFDLAYGILLAVLEVGRADPSPREVVLASAHPAMQRIFERFGFRSRGEDRLFALGSLRGAVPVGSDTSDWLVNYDWTDNCLRPPFGPVNACG